MLNKMHSVKKEHKLNKVKHSVHLYFSGPKGQPAILSSLLYDQRCKSLLPAHLLQGHAKTTQCYFPIITCGNYH